MVLRKAEKKRLQLEGGIPDELGDEEDGTTTEDEAVITLDSYEELGRAEGVLGGYLNDVLEIRGMVMTMYDGRTNLSREVVEEVSSDLAAAVGAAANLEAGILQTLLRQEPCLDLVSQSQLRAHPLVGQLLIVESRVLQGGAGQRREGLEVEELSRGIAAPTGGTGHRPQADGGSAREQGKDHRGIAAIQPCSTSIVERARPGLEHLVHQKELLIVDTTTHEGNVVREGFEGRRHAVDEGSVGEEGVGALLAHVDAHATGGEQSNEPGGEVLRDGGSEARAKDPTTSAASGSSTRALP